MGFLSRAFGIDKTDEFLKACELGQKEKVESILKTNKNVINSQDQYGFTGLITAVIKDRKDVVELLIKNGAKLDMKKKDGQTALITAAQSLILYHGKINIIELLVKSGANLNIQDNKGKTALMNAVIWELFKDAVKLLIEGGAKLDIQDQNGETALMMSAKLGQKDIVELLIRSGADLNIQTKDGKTALTFAATNGHKDVVELIKSYQERSINVDNKIPLTQIENQKPLATSKASVDSLAIKLSRITLIDSRSLGTAGFGGATFQTAIQKLNQHDYYGAERDFLNATSLGLDPLRQGYAYAQIGEIKLKQNDLDNSIYYFLKVFDNGQVLYESADTASKYMSIIYSEMGRLDESQAFLSIAARTTSKLGYSLSPDAASKVKQLVYENLAKK